jgi:serralysin
MPEKFTLDQIILQLQTQWDVVEHWPYDDGGPRHWSKVDVKYGFFPGQVPSGPYSPVEVWGYQPMTDAQATLAREAFELWDDLIAINLTETTDWSDVDISFAYSDYTAGGDSYANVDDGDIGSAEIWLNTSRHDVQEGTLDYGTGFGTYLHEIGHSLGLSHPGSYNHSADYIPDAEYAQDTKQFTVMSYFEAGEDGSAADHGEDPSNPYDWPSPNLRPFSASTPLLHDIAAIQAMYGADMTTRTGDTVYGFNSNAGRGAFDFTQNTHPIIAIWDAGGNDTIDTSGFSDVQTIDLHVNLPTEEDPFFSDVGGLKLNVAIAYNVVIENAIGGSGIDTITGNAAANRLEGRAGDDKLYGLEGADILVGGQGGDTLDGGAHADIMIGGQGDDTYYVDTVEHWDPVTQTYLLGNDRVIENLNEGDDGVAAYVSYALPDNVENLQLLVGGLSGYGNGLDNVLSGTVGAEHLEGFAGNDVLFGGQGADVMIGGQGDDTYWVDTVEHWDPVTQTYLLGNDQVIENAGEGSDLVHSTVTYTLPDNVERLTLEGVVSVDGTGNNLDNELIGNLAANRLKGLAGNDLLDGKAGADTMVGGTGDDTYVVDNVGDQVIETSAQGADLVRSSISYTLGANVENLTLTGSAVISGTGNSLANTIIGNSGANILTGGAGNDTLNGGAGNDRINGGGGNDTINGGLGADTLTGGKGSDIFFFNSALSKLGLTSIDEIKDFSVADDTIQLENAVFTELSPFGGTLSAGAFFIGAAAHDRDDRIVYDSSTGSLMYDADGNGGGQAKAFAVLEAGLALTPDDFFIV